MERPAGGRELAAEPHQIDGVVGVAAIGVAAPRGDQAAVPQLAQVVRDQVLGLADQAGQLVHRAVAPGELGQEAPTQGMPGQLQELGRGDVGGRRLHGHSRQITSIRLDASILFVGSAIGAPACSQASGPASTGESGPSG